jgi:hypothetical protein
MRISTRRRVANSDRLALLAARDFQSKPRSTVNTSRSLTPSRRAAARMASAASSASSGSSPKTV